MSNPKPSIETIIQKENPEFVAEVSGLSLDGLITRLAALGMDAQQVDEAKEADEELSNAKALASELGAPYRESKKAISIKSQYLVSLVRAKEGSNG